MSTPTDNPQHRVLHIRSTVAPSLLADKVGEQLAVRAILEDVCGDIYGGLIRIGRADSKQRMVICVCLDELVPSEYEFFSIVARVNRSAEVYIYGNPRRGEDIVEAVRCGASGPVTPELFDALFAPAAPESVMGPCSGAVEDGGSGDAQSNAIPAVCDDSELEIPGVPDSELSAPQAAIDERFDRELQREMDAEESSEEGEQSGGRGEDSADAGPRVPWLRYSATPGRMPPSRSREIEQPELQSAEPVVPEPLLTEAELRALIGDDIAGIAPPDNGSGLRDESDVGGGDS